MQRPDSGVTNIRATSTIRKCTTVGASTMAEDEVGGNAAAILKSYVERASRLMDEGKGMNDDIANVIAEAKANGFDGPAVRRAIRMFRMEQQRRDEMIALD